MYGLDLFSGIGGLTKALEDYVRPVAYCENDRYAQSVLLSRMSTGNIPIAPIWDDIKTITQRHITPPPSTSSTAASPAKTFPSQAAEQVWVESVVDYFSRSSGSRASYDLDSFSWRTSQQLLFEEQSELLASFAAYGMTAAGEFFPLRMWERTIAEKDGGFWRTPLGSDGEKMGWGNLPHQAKMWPTPCGPNNGGTNGKAKLKKMLWRTPQAWNANQGPKSEGLFNKCMETGQSAITLVDQVTRWPTPQAHDVGNGNPKRVGRFGTKHGGRNLNDWAAMWPTPTSRAGQNPGEHGQGGQNLATVAGGQLNPTWVEWLMGYPSEWTVLKDWATQWFRPKRVKRLKG